MVPASASPLSAALSKVTPAKSKSNPDRAKALPFESCCRSALHNGCTPRKLCPGSATGLPASDVIRFPLGGAVEFLENRGIGDRFGQAAGTAAGNFFGSAALEFELRFFGVPRGVIGHEKARMIAQRRIFGGGFFL